MKKLGILALAIVFALPFAVFALSSGDNYKQSLVTYDAGEISYEWSIPQSFTLAKTEDVVTDGPEAGETIYRAIVPVTFSNVELPENTTLSVMVESQNNFKLMNGTSAIPYEAWGHIPLYFDADGTQNISLIATTSDIVQATAFGIHTDTLTFTVSGGYALIYG